MNLSYALRLLPDAKLYRFLTVLIILLLCGVSLSCYAGEEREGFSSTKGMFLSFKSGGLVGFDTKEKLTELVDHCAKGKSIFNHTLKRNYQCKVTSLPGADFSQFARIEIIGVTASEADEKPHVFTIRYSRFPSWEIRALLDQETAAILALLRTDRTRYGSLIERLNFRAAVALKKPNSNSITYFVPGEKINDEDGFYSAERHYVFVTRGNDFRYQGRLVAKPLQFVDVDTDDFPEVVVEESCDGMCVSIWSIHNGVKLLGHLGGH